MLRKGRLNLMRTSELRQIILKTFKKGEFYGYDIHKKLISIGMAVETGRLYKVLNQMLKENWLESRWEKSPIGPKKKLYKLGKEGKAELNKILMSAIKEIHKAYGDYLLGLPHENDVFKIISNTIAIENAEHCNVALIVESPSPMYERLLSHIQNRMENSSIFIVKPKKMVLDLNLIKTVNIDGNFHNIPLKDNFVDLLMVVNIPRDEIMKKALKEWRRVINNKGRIAIISPTVLFGDFKDPLSIGDFIEKWEHDVFEKRKVGEGKVLIDYLKKHFYKVEEMNIVHMKLVLAMGSQTDI